MAKMTDVPDVQAYSSGVKKVLILGKDGRNMVSGANPLPVDAVVSVDTVNLQSELKVDTGHDLYLIDNVTVDDDYKVSFPTLPGGLDLLDIQSFENKTKGCIYITAGATVDNSSIQLDPTKQAADTAAMSTGDKIEIIFRGPSRFTNGEQITKLKSVPIKKIHSHDLDGSALDYTTTFGLTTKVLSVLIKFDDAVDETVTLKFKSGDGSNYDVILRKDLLESAEDYFWQPYNELILTNDDELQILCTNNDSKSNVYITVLGETR